MNSMILYFMDSPLHLAQHNLEESNARLRKLHKDYDMIVKANKRLERENRELTEKLEKHQGKIGGNVLRKVQRLVANDLGDADVD